MPSPQRAARCGASFVALFKCRRQRPSGAFGRAHVREAAVEARPVEYLFVSRT